MKLIVYTDCQEFYGEAGVGRWKPKFGADIEVASLSVVEAADSKLVARLLNEAAKRVSINNPACRVSVVDWELLEDAEKTQRESELGILRERLTPPVALEPHGGA
jgi:hypothetical protein